METVAELSAYYFVEQKLKNPIKKYNHYLRILNDYSQASTVEKEILLSKLVDSKPSVFTRKDELRKLKLTKTI